MIAGWILLGLVGAAAMAFLSRIALREGVALSGRIGVPKYVVGLTLVSFGTDLPEIVNSLVSSSLGHGDINLGDSIGSVLTQATLVLGLVPFAARTHATFQRADVLRLGLATLALLALDGLLTRDGALSHADGAGLVFAGGVALALAARSHEPSEPLRRAAREAGATRHAFLALAALSGVAAGAGALVTSIVEISLAAGAPEYALSFFAASLGTSLPELVVNLLAVRRGEREMALGGVLGACLLDASISAGIGPLFFPTPVTAQDALVGALIAGAGVALASFALGVRGRHDRATGALLIAAYVAAYAARRTERSGSARSRSEIRRRGLERRDLRVVGLRHVHAGALVDSDQRVQEVERVDVELLAQICAGVDLREVDLRREASEHLP